MTTKEKIIRTVEGLPPDATIEDAMERLLFLAKVERGLKQADEGQTVTHAEVKERDGRMVEVRWTQQAVDDLEAISYDNPKLTTCDNAKLITP